LVPAFVACLHYARGDQAYLFMVAQILFVTACVSDALDGFLARKNHMKTRLGSLIDPAADKLLLIAAYLSLTFMAHLPEVSRLPVWVTLIVISRDGFIVAGATLIFVMQNRFSASTNWLGKFTTVSQMILVGLFLFGFPEWIRTMAVWVTVAFTVASAVSYMRSGAKILSENGG